MVNSVKSKTDNIIDFYRKFERYDHLSYEELYQDISPCVRQGQYKIFEKNKKIWGFTNWAFVNQQVLDKYLETGSMQTLDWKSGLEMCWIEVVADGNMSQMMSWMKDFSVRLLGEDVNLYWIRSNTDKIRARMKIATKRNWKWENLTQ